MFSYLRRGPGFYRRVGGLAVPIILQNLITSTLAMADTFMVGMLGEVPMAAVTLANIPLFVMQLFFFGVQSGSAVLISQYWGRQDRQSINRVVGVALWAVNLVSITFALVLLLIPGGSISQEMRTTALAVSLTTLAMGNVAFLLYDRALHNMLQAYRILWQPRLHKMLGR